ncbi:MAG: hypothetical protein PHE86_06680 [Candidatus Marinimicrobia bacterium]|nr:hypothetical protein [Candidatus Neomarinimicrobiota bacterium]MDD5581703.1 hypothetical protein [Candidatus Neomarinimicrobiota bacterium]
MRELSEQEMKEHAGGYLPASYLACLAGIAALGYGIVTAQGMVINIAAQLIYRYCD